MSFDTILGQNMAIGQLKGAIIHGRINHAYLFVGPKGVGKALTAREMAKALNCENQVRGDACEKCPTCQKNNSHNHPQVQFIAPAGSSIKISQIRQLQEKIKYKNFDGLYHIIILEQIDTITVQGANSLLKILEEPPPATVFILMAEQATSILPTILSRCQLIKFNSLPPPLIEKILLNRLVEAKRAKIVSLLTNGDVTAAIEVCADNELWQWREAAIELAGIIRIKDMLAALKYMDELFRRKLPAVKLLDFLVLWYRDIIIWQETKNTKLLVNGDKLYLIAEDETTIPELLDMVEQVLKSRREIMGNLNEGMVLEALLVQLTREVV